MGITFPNFKLYYKVTGIKTVLFWHKNRNVVQRSKIEIPEINFHIYIQLIFDKVLKNTQWKKCSFFNKWLWKK